MNNILLSLLLCQRDSTYLSLLYLGITPINFLIIQCHDSFEINIVFLIFSRRK